MGILKDISKLLEEDVISAETADRIRQYYKDNEHDSGNRLIVIFSVLGAILVGLGIILMIAHNWDQLPKTIKIIFAFIPMLIGQFLCAYTLLKKRDNLAWKESSSAFLFFGVGACISLISQIYNIPGELSSFMLTWMLLTIPMVYIMRSSMLSILCILGITYFAYTDGYYTLQYQAVLMYWVMIASLFPFYYLLYKNNKKSNALLFHHWLIPLSLTICLGTMTNDWYKIMFVSYFSLFAIFYLIGNWSYFKHMNVINNAYRIIGSIGIMVILYMTSFNWFWEDLLNDNLKESLNSIEFIVAVLFTLIGCVLLFFEFKNKEKEFFDPLSWVFLLFALLFFIGGKIPGSVLIINLVILGISIAIIREGAKRIHLGLMNYGLILLSILIACRFFDMNISFILRGLLFVSLGAGFFIANIRLLRKARAHE